MFPNFRISRLWRVCWWTGWGALGVLIGLGHVAAAPLAPLRFVIQAGEETFQWPLQASHSLDLAQPSVRRIVIALHSADYRPQNAFDAVLGPVEPVGEAAALCVLAPQFLERAEVPSGVADDLLYWNAFPFRGTSNARFGPSAEMVSISLFDCLDQILAHVSRPGLFPQLETIVLVGHSAGGQAVHRYAIAGRFPSTLDPARRIHLRYVVIAPSSYAYFSSARDPEGDGTFAVPSPAAREDCPDYDDWGYGLQDLWAYPAETGRATLAEQYATRFVHYLVGSEDNDPADPSLATGCQPQLQGPHRVARATTYFRHLESIFGPALRAYQTFDLIPGVGHSYADALDTSFGRRYLFDADPTDTDLDGQSDWFEWIAGTDPGRPEDRFALRFNAPVAPTGFRLSWSFLPARHYSLWVSSTPVGPFTEILRGEPSASEPLLHWIVPLDQEPRFLRLEVRLQ